MLLWLVIRASFLACARVILALVLDFRHLFVKSMLSGLCQCDTESRATLLRQGLTQAGLAARAGVSLPILRKFEQKGLILLESFLKIAMVLGALEDVFDALKPSADKGFDSIDDVLAQKSKPPRKRGWRK